MNKELGDNELEKKDNAVKNSETDSNEIAKQIVQETANDTEYVIKRITEFFKKLWSIFLNPSQLSAALQLNKLDSIYELFLRDKRLLKLLALIVAFILSISVRYTPDLQERYSVDINGYTLTTYYDTERMVIEGLPASVDVTLVGEKNQVDIAKTKASFEIYADLSELPPGTHNVNIEYEKLSEDVDIKLNPSTVVVTIMELTETNKDLNYEFVNLDKIDEMYVLNTPQLALDSVKIKGPQEVVNEVATVKAIIDVSDLTKLTDYNALVFAYDKFGDKLDVEITPSNVDVSVEVTSPSKVIPIEPVITGNPPEGYSVGSIMLTPSEVKVYGEAEELDLIESLKIQIDLYQLDDNQEIIVKLDKPESLHKMDVETIKASVIYEETQTKELEGISIDYQNLAANLKITALSVDEATVDVTLKGAESVLSMIKQDDLNIYIDLTGYEAGEYEVPVMIESPTGVIAELNKTKINVIITE